MIITELLVDTSHCQSTIIRRTMAASDEGQIPAELIRSW